jgi:hypothetical protein
MEVKKDTTKATRGGRKNQVSTPDTVKCTNIQSIRIALQVQDKTRSADALRNPLQCPKTMPLIKAGKSEVTEEIRSNKSEVHPNADRHLHSSSTC